jgi:hypothetical protein
VDEVDAVVVGTVAAAAAAAAALFLGGTEPVVNFHLVAGIAVGFTAAAAAASAFAAAAAAAKAAVTFVEPTDLGIVAADCMTAPNKLGAPVVAFSGADVVVFERSPAAA